MPRNYVIGLLGIGGLFAATALYVVAREQSSRADQTRRISSEDQGARIARLEEKLDLLAERLQFMSVQSNIGARVRNLEQSPSNVSSKPEPARTVTDERPDSPEALEEAKQTVRERQERVARTYAAEPRDPTWAAQAEAHIDVMLKNLEAAGVTQGATLKGECKTNICKVEGTYQTADAQRRTSDSIRSQYFGSGEVRRFEENGELRSTTFLYRQGFGMPE